MSEGLVVERYPRICASCKHLKADLTCPAFPDEIPNEIWWDAEDHREKRKGQTGDTVWELKPGSEKELALYDGAPGNKPKGKLELAAESLLSLLHDR